MAIVASTTLTTPTSVAYIQKWTPLLHDDVGAAQSCAQYTDKSVQVFGTFGGATAALQGSNDGTNWVTLSDPQGVAIGMTSAGIKMVSEASASIRPFVSGGDGTTSLTFVVMLKE